MAGPGAGSPEGRPLSAAARLDWLRLIRSENIGPVTFFRLLEHFGTVEAALRGAPEMARRGGRQRPIRIQPHAEAAAEFEKLEKFGGRLLAACEPDYPAPLRAIHDPPPVLTVMGHAGLLTREIVAIVGARNASANGRRFARNLAAELGQAGVVVASGLARGIDAEAHAGALESGTVAVVAGGIDVPYPTESRSLYEKSAALGAIVAEQPLGTVPQARHFPRRNRIISGLSQGVVVVEATRRSGSLITARQALDQGRDVFAVPGTPLDPRAQGPNDLIKNGAILIEGAKDILDELRSRRPQRITEPKGLDFSEKPAASLPESEVEAARPEILSRLGPSPVDVDELLRQCQVSPAILATVLLELELAGRLERSAGGRVALVAGL